MKKFPNPDDITAIEFELLVKKWFESCSLNLNSFNVEHRKKINGMDGEYEIDIFIKFTVFDKAEILTLVECKKHKNPIDREYVQILKDRKNSIGAHKAILVSASTFQSGAIKYAEKNGVALIQIVEGSVRYITASIVRCMIIPDDADDYAGLFYGENLEDYSTIPLCITSENNYGLRNFLIKKVF